MRRRLVSAGLVCAAALLTSCSSDGNAAQRTAVPEHPNPLADTRFYVDPTGPAPTQVAKWRKENRQIDAARLDRLAGQPVATWLTGGDQDPYETVRAVAQKAQAADRVPVFTLYNLPSRDCGLYSQGGAKDIDAYLAWVGSVAAALGSAAAVFVVEPDGIAHALSGCLDKSPTAPQERYNALAEAVRILERQPGATTYLDAGNATWIKDVAGLSGSLRSSGVAEADGFALNVANFETTQTSVAYARTLSDALNGAHFVIDTSRNGAGPPPSDSADTKQGHPTWCNPASARLGASPTSDTGTERLDALLWVKQPGDSDGACGPGAPAAGTWWPSYALKLAG